MLKKSFIAVAIMMASSAFASAQDIFWSFSPTEVISTSELYDVSQPGSVYIFSDGLFGFSALDLNFTASDSDVIRFTGGEAFNPTYATIGRKRFNFTEITVDAEGSLGRLFSVNVSQHGVNPAFAIFDPMFVEGVGPNGAFLLARVDFELVNFGVDSLDLEFALGREGAVSIDHSINLNPSLGSATLFVFPPLKIGYCIGDVNLSGNFEDYYADSVDFDDVAPFIVLLASGGYQFEADCNFDGVVDFSDIAPFIAILAGS